MARRSPRPLGRVPASADVVVLGPTEEPFQALVEYATRTCEADLVRGAAAVDLASLTGYTLFVYAADFEHHDGLHRTRRTVPFLVRYSGAGAFQVAWESVMNLTPADEVAIPQARCPVEADAPRDRYPVRSRPARN